MPNYRIIPGKRAGSKLYMTEDGWVFKVHSRTATTIHLRCEYHDGCNCQTRAMIKLDVDILTMNQHEHTHPKDDSIRVRILEADIREAARTVTDKGLRRIFDEMTADHPDGDKITFKRMESGMQKARNSLFPRIPQTIGGFAEALRSKPTSFGINFKGVLELDNEPFAIVLASDELLATLNDRPTFEFMAYDGTYFTVPSLFKQLFTIHAVHGTHFFPALCILMDGKSEEKYQIVFEKMRELVPDFRPRDGMADFEVGSRNAAEHVFADCNLRVRGCYAHSSSAKYKNLQKIGLSKRYNQNIAFKKWCRMIMAAPLLPANQIHDVLNELLEKEFNFGNDDVLVNRFKRYVQRQWMERTSPETLSVYGQDSATNNGCESFHCRLKADIKVHCPNPWTFIVHLNEIMKFRAVEYRRLVRFSPDEIIRNRKPEHVRNIKLRRDSEAKLESGEITNLQFLAIVSHTSDGQIQRLQDAFRQNRNVLENDPDILEELYEEEVVEEPQIFEENDIPRALHGLCRWCQNPVQADQRCIFSCGDGLGCLPCSENFYRQGLISNEGPICPSCNQRILNVYPVRLQLE